MSTLLNMVCLGNLGLATLRVDIQGWPEIL